MRIRLLTLLFAAVAAGIQLQASERDSIYASIEQSIVALTFPADTFDISSYGASPKASAAKNQSAINRAVAECSHRGGGTVRVPEGSYNTGAIRLLDNVDLHLDSAATLLFAFDPELYPVVATSWEGLDCYNLSPCIYANCARNVAITGSGTIDGGADTSAWWPWCGKDHYGWTPGSPRQQDLGRPQLQRMAEDGIDPAERRFGAADCLRPQLVNFRCCEGVLVEGVTMLRSPFWVVHPLLCRNVTVRGVRIINDGPNGDGCDPESCDGVLIEDCYFDTGDDCIAIKSGRNNDGRRRACMSQNIIVRRCHMRNGHGGLVIGSEITGGARNIFVEDCTMDSPNLDRVVRIKTNTCRGGIVEKVYARRIRVGQCKEAVLKINLDYEPREQCCRGYVPTVRDIYLDSVTCERSRYGVMIIGLDSVCSVYDVDVDNCRFSNVADGNSITGRVRGLRFSNTRLNDSLVCSPPYSLRMARSEMQRTPRSYLLDFSSKPRWSYVMGIELEAILNAAERYSDTELMEYCREYVDTMIMPDGSIRGYSPDAYNLDNVRTGKFLAAMHRRKPAENTRKAIATLMTQLRDQPRTLEGVYWHKAIYASQVWLDGIFMGLPVRVGNAADFHSSAEAAAIYDDAVEQLVRTYARTYDQATGLNRHAWDETRSMFWADSVSGLSQHCWGRAQGWYTMALVEILDALPAGYARRNEVEQLLTKCFEGIMRWQDPISKSWYQVMDSPGREGNYLESTASAMFTYAMLSAARKGYVDASYLEKGREAYHALIDNFVRTNPDGTISLTNCCAVSGLGPKDNPRRDGSFAYYLSEPVRDNDPKGIGPFIWASLEMEQ